MKDSIFFDTNVLVYAHTDFDTLKQYTAQQLIIGNNSFVSTQVLQELTNTLYKKFKQTRLSVENVLNNTTSNNNLHINNENTIFLALEISERYKYSFYDCLIVAAALECGCSVLYSEDLQHKQSVNQKLTILNPFK